MNPSPRCSSRGSASLTTACQRASALPSASRKSGCPSRKQGRSSFLPAGIDILPRRWLLVPFGVPFSAFVFLVIGDRFGGNEEAVVGIVEGGDALNDCLRVFSLLVLL